ncbi:MAG: peptidoglycan DD-metalloendopeptidase family protein [Burkholderiales bacterium]|nr:peptidoglycan DD-metalloendopeptidase family protein [Burkholderiales bacterium]
MYRIHPVQHSTLRRRLWLPVMAALPFFGVMAAFGIDPGTVVEPVPTQTVVQPLDLPQPQATDTAESFDYWSEERIRRGDTLASLLQRMGVAEEEQASILAAGRASSALQRLAPGRSMLARVTSSGRLLLLRYLASDERLVTIERVQGEFVAEERAVRLEMRPIMRSAEIRSSLFAATDAADIPDSIASQLAEIFSGEIDFHRDLRRGDRLSVVYEAYYHDGRLVRTGRLLSAEFVNAGQAHRAVYYRDGQGREGYFTPHGQSLKRAFLKSPLPFSRISSGFTSARFHPVLQQWRAHRGIDYAAPTGTPVRAVADAVVAFAGWQNGYGNIVVLDHHKPYSTAYAHLSRFAPGVKRGRRVNQGDIIGYVGATGLATGPHLHYEFRVAGVQRDPQTLKLPIAFSLEGRERSRFLAQTQPYVARLELLRGSNLAAFD